METSIFWPRDSPMCIEGDFFKLRFWCQRMDLPTWGERQLFGVSSTWTLKWGGEGGYPKRIQNIDDTLSKLIPPRKKHWEFVPPGLFSCTSQTWELHGLSKTGGLKHQNLRFDQSNWWFRRRIIWNQQWWAFYSTRKDIFETRGKNRYMLIHILIHDGECDFASARNSGGQFFHGQL